MKETNSYEMGYKKGFADGMVFMEKKNKKKDKKQNTLFGVKL